MVPSVLLQIANLPLTINGKLYRRALPEPEFTNKNTYVGPRNEVEQKICQIWAEVLGLDATKVGVQDNFFRLGGNSILSIKLISRINQELTTSISLSSIFKYKTIKQLVNHLDDNKNYPTPPWTNVRQLQQAVAELESAKANKDIKKWQIEIVSVEFFS